MASRERAELLVTVKAYPAISKKYGEVVCVAGIRTDQDPAWIRLFPVPFRDLAWPLQFRKYQVISVETTAPKTDPRPESRTPVTDSLRVGKVINTSGNWQKRATYVEPLMVESMCEIQRQQKLDGTSLGVFRPAEVTDLTWEKAKEERENLIAAGQMSLMGPGKTSNLERIPYTFRYHYRCSTKGCRGHKQSIIDWELGQAYRNWRKDGGTEEEVLDAIRTKWLGQLCADDRDTRFFVGNMHLHPEGFLVLGVFWPKAKGGES